MSAPLIVRCVIVEEGERAHPFDEFLMVVRPRPDRHRPLAARRRRALPIHDRRAARRPILEAGRHVTRVQPVLGWGNKRVFMIWLRMMMRGEFVSQHQRAGHLVFILPSAACCDCGASWYVGDDL